MYVQTSKYARSPAILAGPQQLYVLGFFKIPIDGVFGLSPFTCLKLLLVSDHTLVF